MGRQRKRQAGTHRRWGPLAAPCKVLAAFRTIHNFPSKMGVGLSIMHIKYLAPRRPTVDVNSLPLLGSTFEVAKKP